VLPLHAALVLHLLVLNALYRWRFPASSPDAAPSARGVEGNVPLWQ